MDARIYPLLRLPRTLDGFDYHIPPGMKVRTGDLVLVPFRGRPVRAVVWETADVLSHAEKDVSRVLVSGAVTPLQRVLFENTAAYYGGSIATLLKSALPSFPLRGEMEFSGVRVSVPRRKNRERERVYVYSGYTEKYHFLAADIAKKRGTVLCVFPTRAACLSFLSEHPEVKKKSVFVEPGRPAAASREAYAAIRTGRIRIVLTTKSGIFSPFCNIETIYIDDDEHPAHKQYDQQPYLDTRHVAEMLAEHAHAEICRLTQAPRVSLWYEFSKKRGTLHRIGKAPQYIQPHVINMRAERAGGNRALLSESLLRELSKQSTQPALLYLNRLEQEDDTEHTQRGVQTLLFELREHFPNKNIVAISGMHPILQRTDYARADIIITTERFRSVLTFDMRLSMIAVVDIDSDIQRAHYLARERCFQILILLQNLAAITASALHIQTYEPTQLLFRTLHPKHWAIAFKDILTERKELAYPPFWLLTRIILPDATATTQQSLLHIQRRLPSSVELTPIFPGRGRNPSVAILREPPAEQRIGSTLAGITPASWKIDVDPLDLA